MIKVSIHQPMYLPYPGFFNKMKSVDIFVFLDDADYSSGYYYNRNRIKCPNGELILTVPVMKNKGITLNEIKIAQNIHWQEKHLKSLVSCYEKSGHFKDYRDFFEEIYSKKWHKLHDLNIETISYLMKQLGIEIPPYFSSELLKNHPPLKKTERLITICKELDADIYLSGSGGKDYLDKSLFEKNNIKLEFQNYVTKEYKQLYGDFIPNLSIVDLLFNMGEKAKEYV